MQKNGIRIASLTPSNTEILHALGLIDQLAGIDDYSDYPANLLENVPRLGPDLQIRMEDVIAFKPDLVLASLSVPGMEHVVEQLKSTGLPYVVLNPKSISEIWETIRLVGELTGTSKQAALLIDQYEQRIHAVRAAYVHLEDRPRLYWEWWPHPCISPGGQNWLTEISHLAGAKNIFADVDRESVIDAAEEVKRCNPDYFLAVWCGVKTEKVPYKKILERTGWQLVEAIKQKRVYILEEGLYCRPSPRLVDGLESLVKIIHPK
ncbi:cobalamin-binding protein [Fodinisporobacter ferrooxydans]|uniref:Cobalamin-binding protein n=1 Tax=Fodinisporobacter ferrooxydans TaxID=2901836 RepID=A0ABY4CIQ7_9BACL|nr:cobalamin-binding protein [Alicyclobacillaceae bacterium MYW30-H2]